MSQHFSSIDSSALFVQDATGAYRLAEPGEVFQAAQQLLVGQIRHTDVMTSPGVVRDYLRMRLSALAYEMFAVVHLDQQNRVIEYVEMFRGTVAQTSVYPREVVREAMQRNSAAVMLVHNHPSGSAQPSRADEMLTQTLKQALALVDVRVLDHLVVAGTEIVSFAEKGLL